MTDDQTSATDRRPEVAPEPGALLFKVAMGMILCAMLMGPVIVITSSKPLLDAAVVLGIVGIATVLVAAVRSYIA